MNLTGDHVDDRSEFSASKWLATTNFYLEKIQHDLTSKDWTEIFQALHCYQGACT
jgi:hypothetical protein